MVLDDVTRPALPLAEYEPRLAWLRAMGIDPLDLAGKVFVIAGYKGGIGKTMFAIELAYLLGGVLVDFEWDDGSSSVALGVRPDRRVRAPLLEALERDRAPRVVKGGPWKPDLVPGHKDFEVMQPTVRGTADLIEKWAAEYAAERGCPIVIDTHPGGSPSTLGAIAASNVTLVPAILGEREMEALTGMLRELAGNPLLVVPNKVRRSPQARFITWLENITGDGVPVAPMVRRYDWLEERGRRMAICAAGRPVSKRAQPLVDELHEVAETAVRYVL